jgi:hypothetical protein
MYLPYTVGEGKIFSEKDIEIAKKSISFEREYNLKFLGLVGNIFLPEKIDVAIALGRDLDIYKRIADKHDMILNAVLDWSRCRLWLLKICICAGLCSRR